MDTVGAVSRVAARGGSLAARATLHISLFLLLAVGLTTAAIFLHVREQRRDEMLGDLQRFNHERVERQNIFFDTVHSVQQEADRRLKLQLKLLDGQSVDDQFDRLFPLRPDGTRRSIDPLFDGMQQGSGDRVFGIGAFMANGRGLTPADKRLLLAAFHVVRGLGDSFGPELRNFYFFTPDNRMILFAPDRPDRLLFYRHDAPPGLDYRAEEMAVISSPEGNPERSFRCTTLRHRLQEKGTKTWGSACITPVDLDGRHVGAFGNTIDIAPMLQHLPSTTLPGTVPVLIAQDGRLLRKGDSVATSSLASFPEIVERGDAQLNALWRAARDAGSNPTVVEADDADSFVAVERTRGPGWYSLLVYPADRLRAQAFATAAIVLYLGLALLLIQAFALSIYFRRALVTPLKRFINDTKAIAGQPGADLPEALPVERDDELGALARAFATMAREVADARQRLESRVEARTAELHEKTRLLHHESQRLAALRRIGATVAAELQTDRVVQIVLDSAVGLTASSFGLFFRKGDKGLFHAASRSAPDRETLDRLMAEQPTLFEAPGFDRGLSLRSGTRAGEPSLVEVPVTDRDGEVIGGMLFGHPDAGWYDVETRQSLADIAAQTAIALENAALYEAARHELTERVRTEERLRLAVEAAGFGVFEWDVANRGHRWTAETRAIYGLDETTEITHELVLAAYHPDDHALMKQRFAEQLRDGDDQLSHFEFRIVRPTGEVRWVQSHARNYRDASGSPLVRGIVQDITDRKRDEVSLQLAKERLGLALDSTGVGVWDWDIGTDRLWQSASALAIQGLSAERRSSDIRNFLRHVHPQDRRDGFDYFRRLIAGRISGTVELEYRLARSGGGWVWVHERSHVVERSADGRPTRIVGTRHDISVRKHSDEQLWWTANHDSLTGLANRAWFRSTLETALAQRAPDLGLLLIDLDGFKQVNDTLGHDAGDLLLQVAARRLRDTIGGAGHVARLGGDEFAVILPGVADPDHLASWAMRIQDAYDRPVQRAGRALKLGSTIGGTLCPSHGSEASTLMKNADLALYEAKGERRGSFALYQPEMRRRLEDERTTLSRVRAAIADGRIMAFYQPQVSLHTEALVGFEALLRWRHPKSGVMLPGSIASAFEDPELAVMLGETIIELVIADIRRWRAQGIAFGRVAINASSAEFSDGSYAERLLARLAAANIPTSCIEVEVTESVFLARRAGPVHDALATLSAAGVTIALDDFGTGYASLSHLKQFPVDIIKIDQSFVRDLEQDPDDAAIVRAVIGLGQSLGKKVVAEGVETVGQMRLLNSYGCPIAQGYLFHAPADPEEVAHLVRQWSGGTVASPIARMLKG